jgi:diguanylate cyclase (GGDEF)-like protein
MRQPTRRAHLAIKLAMPVLLAISLSLLLYVTLKWSAQKADELSLLRQQQLVDLIVSRMQTNVAHDQESATVWDDAVKAVSGDTVNVEWLDQNLGTWMHTYFGHDGAFVISPQRKLEFGYLNDKNDAEAAYRIIEPAADGLIANLQARLEAEDQTGTGDHVLSIGESDLAPVGGRPAIVSVKPIISDTGNLVQVPGKQYLHVAVRYLDGGFLTSLAKDYLFQDLRFTWKPDVSDGKSYAALRQGSGKVLGYFSWSPFQPGRAVMHATIPVLVIVAFLLFVVMTMLGAMIWKRSSKLEASRAQLEHLAHNDILTGLANRLTFTSCLDASLAASGTAALNAVLYLDLDRFKDVNDTLGHPVGDQLIIQVAARLREIAGAGTLLARVGGDEFTAVVNGTSQQDIENICGRFIAAIRQPFAIDGQPILIGLSIGVAIAHGSNASGIDLTRKADIALYHAKSAGRNRYAIFGSHMEELIKERRQMEADLRKAIDDTAQIEVHYQPVFSAVNMEIKGVEALVRWRHPVKGLIPPDTFIPIAEETRLIVGLGQFVLREACSAAKDWPGLDVAVNASAIELRTETYALRVISTLEQLGFEPGRLEIEITESALADGTGNIERNIAALRSLGVRFALDDFGTGFSSFGRLQRLDVDRIKIDKCFVDGFGKPGGNEDIVRAMIGLAHAKGLQTTAEGVETVEQNAILKNLGCDDLQGFLHSRPVTRNEITEMVEVPRNRAEG